MATTTPRRMQIFKIQKRLLALSTWQLQTVASAVDEDRDTQDLAVLSEPELFDIIVDYLRSEKLKGMDDEGKSQILHLNNMLDGMSRAPDREDAVGGAGVEGADDGGVVEAAPLQVEDTVTRQHTSSTTATMDRTMDWLLSPTRERDIHTPQPTMDRDNNTPARNHATTSPARSINSAGGALPGRASPSSSMDRISEMEMGSTRDDSNEEKQEEGRLNDRRSSKRLRFLEDKRRSCLRRGKRVRYHCEENEEGHEHDEEEEDGDVIWLGPGSSSRDTLTQRTLDKKRASGVLDVIPVTCGSKKGTLDVEQLARGEVCIECEGCRFSPTAFENFGGKGNNKKWKQSIYYGDQPLELLFKQGHLTTPGFKKRNTEDKKMNNCRKMEIGGHTIPVQQRNEKEHYEVEEGGEDEDSEGERRTESKGNDSEMKEGEKRSWFILKGYEDIGEDFLSRTCLKIPLKRLSATKRSILSSNSKEDLESENWCMPLEDCADDDDETQHSEEPREDSTGTETEDMMTTEMPLLTRSDLPLNSCQCAEEVNAEESSARETCRRALPKSRQMTKASLPGVKPHVSGIDRQAATTCNLSEIPPFPIFSISNEQDDAVVSHRTMTTEYQEVIKRQETDGPIQTQLCEEQVGEVIIKEEQIKTESDGQSSSHGDGRLHTSGSENNTQPVATGKTNDETTVQQQSIQSEPATSTLLSQNHHLPSSVPNAHDQNTKRKTYGFKRKRPSSLTWKQGCCGQDKALEKRRERREMVMLTTLRNICDSQHRMCQALEQLCSKQDTVIELLKRLTDQDCSHTAVLEINKNVDA